MRTMVAFLPGLFICLFSRMQDPVARQYQTCHVILLVNDGFRWTENGGDQGLQLMSIARRDYLQYNMK